jgi:hypothetical protein
MIFSFFSFFFGFWFVRRSELIAEGAGLVSSFWQIFYSLGFLET